MIRIFTTFLFFVLFIPAVATAQTVKPLVNIGFIPNNIWYSEYPFFAGENVRIYTIVFNSGKGDLLGTISFSDGAKLLGTKDFSVSGGGKTQDVWIDWVPERGEHSISAVITSARISRAGQPDEPVELAYRESGAQVSFADSDNDHDRIGDTTDTDDDNDGVLDADEVAQKTDPLRADTDGDGVSDGKDDLPLFAEEKKDNPFFAGEKLVGVQKFLSENTPEPIKDIAENIIAETEHFRLEQKDTVAVKKEEAQLITESFKIAEKIGGDKMTDIEQGVIDNVVSFTKKPFAYAQFFFWSLLLVVLTYKTAFYLITFFLIWKIGKFVVTKLRGRF